MLNLILFLVFPVDQAGLGRLRPRVSARSSGSSPCRRLKAGGSLMCLAMSRAEGPRGHQLEILHPCQRAVRPGTRMQETDHD